MLHLSSQEMISKRNINFNMEGCIIHSLQFVFYKLVVKNEEEEEEGGGR